MAFLVGAFLSLAVGGLLDTGVGLDRDHAFYPTVVAVIASQVLFAVMADSTQAFLTGTAVAAAYLAFLLLRPRREHGV